MLKNFEVIEITKKVSPLTLILESNKMRFTKGIVEALEYAPLVRFLIDRQNKRLAVQITGEKDTQKAGFSKPEADQKGKAVLLQNADLLALVRGIMPEWDPQQKYSVNGVYSKGDKAVIFDLKKAEQYSRRRIGDADSESADDERQDAAE